MFEYIRNLSLAKQLTIMFLPFALAFASFFFIYQFNNSKNVIEANTEKVLKSNIDIVGNLINDLKNKALALSIAVSQADFVEDAYLIEDNLAGSDFLKTKITEYLSLSCQDSKNKSIQIHFHKNPATSFLRSWTEKRFDDLTKFRPSIIEVSKTKKPLSTIEFGVGGFLVRGIAPIINRAGEYLGSCEVMFDIQDAFKLSNFVGNNSELVFLVNESVVENSIEKKDIDKFYTRKIKNYYVSNIKNQWANPEIVFKESSKDEPLASGNSGDVYYNVVKVNNHNNQTLGYIVGYVNNSEVFEKSNIDILIVSIIMTFVFLIATAIFIFIVNASIIKPIRKATFYAASIASGNLKDSNYWRAS